MIFAGLPQKSGWSSPKAFRCDGVMIVKHFCAVSCFGLAAWLDFSSCRMYEEPTPFWVSQNYMHSKSNHILKLYKVKIYHILSLNTALRCESTIRRRKAMQRRWTPSSATRLVGLFSYGYVCRYVYLPGFLACDGRVKAGFGQARACTCTAPGISLAPSHAAFRCC